MRLRAIRLPKPVTGREGRALWDYIRHRDVNAMGILLHPDLQINDHELRFVVHYYDDVVDPDDIEALLSEERKH